MDPKSEALLTIMASLARQESRRLSQNAKPGLQYRYLQGKVRIDHDHFFGYKCNWVRPLVSDARIRTGAAPKGSPGFCAFVRIDAAVWAGRAPGMTARPDHDKRALLPQEATPVFLLTDPSCRECFGLIPYDGPAKAFPYRSSAF